MNYYTFHSGDYLRDTSHLSLIEDAIYRRCLDWYYTNESPLPDDFKKIARLIRASDFLADVEQVVSEFFILGEDGWSQSRCDAEIGIYHEKAQKARENGQKGGRPKTKTKPNHNPEITDSVFLANQTLTESKANQEPRTNNQEPITNNQISISAYAQKNMVLEWFDSFWQQYPNKTAKQASIKAWSKLKVTESLYQQIMIAVAKQKSWQKWQEGYIPNPATWLNGKRWEDVEPVRVNSGGGDMAQYIRETSERLRKQDESVPFFDDSFLIEDSSHD